MKNGSLLKHQFTLKNITIEKNVNVRLYTNNTGHWNIYSEFHSFEFVICKFIVVYINIK